MIYLAAPCYGGMGLGTVKSVLYVTKDSEKVIYGLRDYSALTLSFNDLWCDMLNRREESEICWWVMLHSDIDVQDAWWLDKLIGVADESGSDVLGVVSPIKDERGVTSTGLFDIEKQVVVKRLVMQEVEKISGDVFELDDVVLNASEPIGGFDKCVLVVNTGCMAVKVGTVVSGRYVKEDWCEKVCFRTVDYLLKIQSGEGKVKFVPQFISEDWLFSADVQKLGKVVKGYKGVKIEHVGKKGYRNWGAWGTLMEDDLS